MAFANFLGFLALVCYVATLLPSILRVVFSGSQRSKITLWLTKHRRFVGVVAFALGLGHGFLTIKQRNLDLFSLETHAKYFSGYIILLILTLLAVTSLDNVRKKLKKNWRRIHRLTYLLMLLLPCHIMYAMADNWSYMTHLEIWSMGGVIILFVRRKQIELQRKSKTKVTNEIDLESTLIKR